MTIEQMKQWVDSTEYEQLLSKWRFAPAGDPFFQGEMGDYYSKKMNEKREEVRPEAHTRASKSIDLVNSAIKELEGGQEKS